MVMDAIGKKHASFWANSTLVSQRFMVEPVKTNSALLLCLKHKNLLDLRGQVCLNLENNKKPILKQSMFIVYTMMNIIMLFDPKLNQSILISQRSRKYDQSKYR